MNMRSIMNLVESEVIPFPKAPKLRAGQRVVINFPKASLTGVIDRVTNPPDGVRRKEPIYMVTFDPTNRFFPGETRPVWASRVRVAEDLVEDSKEEKEELARIMREDKLILRRNTVILKRMCKDYSGPIRIVPRPAKHNGVRWLDVFLPTGENIGFTAFAEIPSSETLNVHTGLNSEYQRQGYGTALYDFIDEYAKRIGKKFIPSGSVSKAAGALWRKRGHEPKYVHEDQSRADLENHFNDMSNNLMRGRP